MKKKSDNDRTARILALIATVVSVAGVLIAVQSLRLQQTALVSSMRIELSSKHSLCRVNTVEIMRKMDALSRSERHDDAKLAELFRATQPEVDECEKEVKAILAESQESNNRFDPEYLERWLKMTNDIMYRQNLIISTLASYEEQSSKAPPIAMK